MTASLNSNECLEALIDIEAIRQLRRRYALSIASGNMDALEMVFTNDACVTLPLETLRGLDAIKSGLKNQLRTHEVEAGEAPFMHAIARHGIDLKEDDEAFGRCYFVNAELDGGLKSKRLSMFVDRYQRVDGKWLIARSIVDVASANMSA